MAQKTDLKIQTESLLCAAQEQVLQTNYAKYHIDKSAGSSLCGICEEKYETVYYIVIEFKKMTQREYKQRHDVTRLVRWHQCEK